MRTVDIRPINRHTVEYPITRNHEIRRWVRQEIYNVIECRIMWAILKGIRKVVIR